MITHGNGTGYGFQDYAKEKKDGTLGPMPPKAEKKKRKK